MEEWREREERGERRGGGMEREGGEGGGMGRDG